MRIGLNLLFLIPDLVGGTQIYAESLMKALAEVDKTNEYFVFLNREASRLPLPDAPNFHRVVCPLNATKRFSRYAWEQAIFPFRLRRYKLDVLHSLGYVSPLKTPCPSVVTIHDINYIGLREAMPLTRRLPLRFFVPRSAHTSAAVLAVSEFARQEMIQHLHVVPEKVVVTLEACRDLQTAAAPEWNDLATRYQIKAPYIVAFSSSSAHKNIPRFIRAFAQVAPEIPHDLVLIGHLPPDGEIAAEVARLNLKNRVIPTGYVPEEHIFPILSHAQVFAFPSWYEGFGLPVLEAQRAGVPVISSTAASLPEVAGEAALYFDPESEAQMVSVIRDIVNDAPKRESLHLAGLENVKRFSWQKAARETIEVYEQVGRKKSLLKG